MDSDIVATVDTMVAWDTGAARRGLLILNLLLIPLLIPTQILGTHTEDMDMVDTVLMAMATDLDMVDAMVAMDSATDTATTVRLWARSSDDISYDDITSFPRASLSGRSLSDRVLGTLRVHLFLINITN